MVTFVAGFLFVKSHHVIFKCVVPKGLNHMLGVVTISLCVCVYVHFGEPYGPDPGGVGTTFSKMVSDHH